MSNELIQQRLLVYQSQTILEQDNALNEIAQEIALLALSRAGFFTIAAFQGGTALRILYGLDRFSEDLDFILLTPYQRFVWDSYFENMQEEFNAYGYTLEMKSKAKLDKTIRTAFLKTDSIGGFLIIKDNRSNRPKLQIKLEIDTNPPAGSTYDLKYLDFPLPFSIQAQDLPSMFASKCHALLCRSYVKGRDWYDFIWYVARLTKINFTLLDNALFQAGPWQNQTINLTPAWLEQQLKQKIINIDWHTAKQDVARFLKPRELATLEIWSKDFFLSRLDKLIDYL